MALGKIMIDFCDYCDAPRYPCKETIALGPIWTKHGGEPWACEECYEHLRQQDIKYERFKKRARIVGYVVLIFAIWLILTIFGALTR